MKTTTPLRLLAGLVILCIAGLAQAEDRFEVVWNCTLKEGKTLDDAKAAQAAWIAWAKKKGHGKDMRAYVAGPIVADDVNSLMMIDSYPDLETYITDIQAYQSDEGQELEKGFEAVSDCKSNSLWYVAEAGAKD